MRILRKSQDRVVFVLSTAVALFVFLKNAWVNDDAYIMFRSIEQLFAGNGPVWNPHERVQAFTSPLWYLVLSVARIFSGNVYLNAIVVSAILLILTLFVLRRIFTNDAALLMSVFLLSASTGFYDYTSSGLENILAYFLLALYLLHYLQLFALSKGHASPKGHVTARTRHLKFILVIFGLLLCARHDLLLIFLIPTAYAVVHHRSLFTLKSWLRLGLAALSPFILWTLFSTFYYGFPFPNTAYAKLNTGIPRIDLLAQGLQYFATTFAHDLLTLVVILSALAVAFLDRRRRYLRWLGLGVVLDLVYIVAIGGDFMQGRFFSQAYLISAVLVVSWFTRLSSRWVKGAAAAALFAYLALYPHTPLTSPFGYDTFLIDHGVADERGIYASTMSLPTYVHRRKEHLFFPDHRWAHAGIRFRGSPRPVTIQRSTGLFGYFAGTGKIIIDPYALSDPLLARLSVKGDWRIGHFERTIPQGYVRSLQTGRELIVDPGLNHFYHELRIVTQDRQLLRPTRLAAIARFNLGMYDYLIPESLR